MAIAEGVKQVDGAEAVMRCVPETLPDEILEKIGALDAQKAISNVRVCNVDELAATDAVIFGTQAHFGNMCGQMRQLLEATGSLWAQGGSGGQGRQIVYQQRQRQRRVAARNLPSSRFIFRYCIKVL
jgi:NAD(P)H dehydrogenase (quinone)